MLVFHRVGHRLFGQAFVIDLCAPCAKQKGLAASMYRYWLGKHQLELGAEKQRAKP